MSCYILRKTLCYDHIDPRYNHGEEKTETEVLEIHTTLASANASAATKHLEDADDDKGSPEGFESRYEVGRYVSEWDLEADAGVDPNRVLLEVVKKRLYGPQPAPAPRECVTGAHLGGQGSEGEEEEEEEEEGSSEVEIIEPAPKRGRE